MTPMYDSKGRVVAWIKKTNIFHLNGSHAAVVNRENVYSHSGKHLGLFKQGLFRDHSGGAVAFIKDASGRPIKPIPSIPPIPPIPPSLRFLQFHLSLPFRRSHRLAGDNHGRHLSPPNTRQSAPIDVKKLRFFAVD
ncbi:hypothetical protein D3C78_977140 [compost metagenome]